jgi:hypothetical protein
MCAEYDGIFKSAAAMFKVEAAVLKAIAMQESGLVWISYRFGKSERRFYRKYIEGKPEWMKHRYYTEPKVIAASWGLMQIMYTTAVQMGLPREAPWHTIMEPETNILLGARYYANQMDRYGNASAAIAAYNAGSPRVVEGTNRFENQDYVDKVWRFVEVCRPQFEEVSATPIPGVEVNHP